MKNLIFDLDGTLFQADIVAIPAFEKTFSQLIEEGQFNGDIPKREVLLSMFGLTLDDIWEQLFPGATAELKEQADTYMGFYERKYIDAGEGRLYDSTQEILEKAVKAGKRIFIASNGAEEYVDHVVHRMQIAKYVEKAYSAGEYKTKSKVDLVARIMSDYQLATKDTWMIGDRITDIEAGVENQLITVGCLYGYAKDETEFKLATHRIHSMSELMKLIIE